MQSFLEEVVDKVVQQHRELENLVFVLPSKRAGIFLRNKLAAKAEHTFFAPEIHSIENFVEKVSGLIYATHPQQLFLLYESYLRQKPQRPDSFHAFLKWGQTVLQDFNEIDRYLIDAKKLFGSLAEIQELDHWSLRSGKTQMMKDYLAFWETLPSLYEDFNTSLLNKGMGHQGLVYRHSSLQLKNYLEAHADKTFIFAGFNALNTAEIQIIQRVLSETQAEIYWDIDSYFLEDPIHDAGFFIRQHAKTWPYLIKHGISGVGDCYRRNKNIEMIGVPKHISQANYVGQLVSDLHAKDGGVLAKTAIVLGDELLLNPILNAIPKTVERVNITMGFPLGRTGMASFFEMFLGLYVKQNEKGWYYSDIIDFLSHPNVEILFGKGASRILETIKGKNWTYLSVTRLKEASGLPDSTISLMFFEGMSSPQELIAAALRLVDTLKEKLQAANQALELEYLYGFYTLFNQLDQLVTDFRFITDLKSLESLYRELLSSESLDFRGEPLEGLQIMGMLESRNLDFETVILTSVNEGILPSGKSNNSLIPFDLKRYSGLPTYKEKDAVYTYHFYRLLQRAKNIYILYSTEPDDGLGGGERSRLIDQMLTDADAGHHIVQTYASPTIIPTFGEFQRIEKNGKLPDLIRKYAEKGFSPSSLSNYIRNPLAFYKQNLLGINEVSEVEETVAANTLGTIVHDTLEDLYCPLVGKYLTPEALYTMEGKIEERVKFHFSKSYGDGDITRGKNLIALEVVQRYIKSFIHQEAKACKAQRIRILGLERSFKMQLDFPECDFPVVLKGKLDRIDEVDGVLRIIDYKTGKVERKDVEISDWEGLTMEEKKSKAFQLLCYALMYRSQNPETDLEAGIISFKNQSAGLLKFAVKPSSHSRTKNHSISSETLSHFTVELKKLILEICNPEIPFVEKEI